MKMSRMRMEWNEVKKNENVVECECEKTECEWNECKKKLGMHITFFRK